MQVRNDANTAWDNIYPVTKDSVPYANATGSANVYAASITPAPTSYIEGMAVAVKIPVNSTGASTININGLGAKGIKKTNGTDATNLKAGGIYTLRYDGVNFILQGEGASGNATASDLLSGKTATTDAGEIVGTMSNQGAKVITPGIYGQSIPAGYHNGSGYVVGDANLVAGNIKNGISIFGVAGSLEASSPHGVQAYTTPGTYTFTVPQGVNQIMFIATGGGGSGAAKGNNSRPAPGGGGGGGNYIDAMSVTPGQQIPVVVGAGGAGVLGMNDDGTFGNPGGNSSVGSCVAYGGKGAGNNFLGYDISRGGAGGEGGSYGGKGGDGTSGEDAAVGKSGQGGYSGMNTIGKGSDGKWSTNAVWSNSGNNGRVVIWW